MMSVLKEECNKVGFEMHTQKTQVLTNGISDHCDNRRDILKHFNDKLNDDKQAKEAWKQSQLLRQRNKGKKKPNKNGQTHITTVKTKRKNTKKDASKKHDNTQI